MHMAKTAGKFQPTELDLALERDPTAQAARRHLEDASNKEEVAARMGDEDDPNPDLSEHQTEHANREGQREATAASLAGGMIAAEGRPVTAAEAVEKVQEVLEELKRRE